MYSIDYMYVFYEFIDFKERKRKRGKKWRTERERENNVDLFMSIFIHSLVDSCMCPNWVSDQQPRYVP